MNIEKFTDRAKGFLQSAQTVAIRNNHQRIAPEHLLKALLEDDQGMAAGLIRAAGGAAETATQLTDQALAKIAKVSGSGAQQLNWDNDTVRILDNAEQIASKASQAVMAALSATAARRPGAAIVTTLDARADATTYLCAPIVITSPARIVPDPVSTVIAVAPIA